MKRMIERLKRAAKTIAAHSKIQWLGNKLQVFYGSDSKKEAGIKVALTGVSFPIFNYLMWTLTGLTFVTVRLLKAYGLNYWLIFLIIWLGNILLCWFILWLNKKTSADFTLSETYRRSTEAGNRKSRIVGILLGIWFFVTLIFWAGAAQFVIYFEKKLSTFFIKVLVLLIVSAAQMSLWVYVFYLGYEDLSDLFF